ncbi:nucleotidyl transferase AbiEii/AbiGii toxin family protein [Candidatus Micrarchaeota archaeon]|nr:nucleotidyl transferase AbiEii/AbiGii toxin family protein [Candidatus Micrarchaeota archaeon]
METAAHRKYVRIVDSLEDIARCTEGRLVLAGGTALAVFYTQHRVSVDLDFVPLIEKEEKAKERFKGMLSKAGYTTLRAAFSNQFILQFEDVSIKVEIFIPERRLAEPEERKVGSAILKVATLDDLLDMKKDAYRERRKARDIYDVFAIFRKFNAGPGEVKKMLKKCGRPDDVEELRMMITDKDCFADFEKVLNDAG